MSRIYNRYRQRNVTEESAADIDRRHRDAVNAIVQKPDTEVTDAVMDIIEDAGVDKVMVRSPLTCQSRRGVCARCYGRDLARGLGAVGAHETGGGPHRVQLAGGRAATHGAGNGNGDALRWGRRRIRSLAAHRES